MSFVGSEPSLAGDGIPSTDTRTGVVREIIRTRRSAIAGLSILVFFVGIAVFAPLLEPYGVHQQVGPVFAPWRLLRGGASVCSSHGQPQPDGALHPQACASRQTAAHSSSNETTASATQATRPRLDQEGMPSSARSTRICPFPS